MPLIPGAGAGAHADDRGLLLAAIAAALALDYGDDDKVRRALGKQFDFVVTEAARLKVVERKAGLVLDAILAGLVPVGDESVSVRGFAKFSREKNIRSGAKVYPVGEYRPFTPVEVDSIVDVEMSAVARPGPVGFVYAGGSLVGKRLPWLSDRKITAGGVIYTVPVNLWSEGQPDISGYFVVSVGGAVDVMAGGVVGLASVRYGFSKLVVWGVIRRVVGSLPAEGRFEIEVLDDVCSDVFGSAGWPVLGDVSGDLLNVPLWNVLNDAALVLPGAMAGRAYGKTQAQIVAEYPFVKSFAWSSEAYGWSMNPPPSAFRWGPVYEISGWAFWDRFEAYQPYYEDMGIVFPKVWYGVHKYSNIVQVTFKDEFIAAVRS